MVVFKKRRWERDTVSLRAGPGGEKLRAAGRVCLSLARRYNTLDLAGKVSVPRGCGPFGNPKEGDDGGLDDGTVWFPFGAATAAIQAVAACRGIAFLADGIGDTFGSVG